MPFVGRVVLEPVKEAGSFDRGRWEVVEPLIFRSLRRNAVISVPVGFSTDLASVPRFLPITYALTGATSVKAAVVHDFLYSGHAVYIDGELGMLPRAAADDIFDEIMEAEGVPGWRKNLMWAGVRIVGWLSYGKRGQE